MSEKTKSSCEKATDKQLLLEILRQLDEPQIAHLLAVFRANPALDAALRQNLSICWSQDGPHTPRDAPQAAAQDPAGREQTFFEVLIHFVDRAEMTDPEVYRAAGLNRTLWYRLRDNPDARTSKANILKLGLILHLDYLELYYLLALGGHPFAPACDRTDLVVATCIRDGVYDPFEVDSRLDRAGRPTLFSEK